MFFMVSLQIFDAADRSSYIDDVFALARYTNSSKTGQWQLVVILDEKAKIIYIISLTINDELVIFFKVSSQRWLLAC